MMKWQQ